MQRSNRSIICPHTRSLVMTSVAGLLLLAMAGAAHANPTFIHSGKPIHPGCVHALAMQEGDTIPVISAVNLTGCSSSERSRIPVQTDPEVPERLFIEDEALIGEGSFGYRHLMTLENGVFILGILRVGPDGATRASLAAVDIAERPTLTSGTIANRRVLGLIGEVWVSDINTIGLRSVGNRLHFYTGVGQNRVERTIDMSAIAKKRR